MTAFAINSGGTEYYDAKTGGSTNATLDSYTISAGSTLVIRTDTYACPNHSTAFGSLDTVSSSGLGGTLKFDPTYTREIAYTGGSGTVPAYGATISQGGVSGVFLGVWADWQSQTVVPGGTVPASGYIKLGGITGGTFAAGALTGITATCSGADSQSWIETLVPDGAVWTISRLLTMKTDATVWYEIGATNGSAGQVIPCPTTGSFAGTFPGIWVETGAGTGIYERWFSVGSMPATSTTRTDASCKMFWQTTSGIRIGNDGTNNVGFLPVTGCKVRIPSVIINTCTRTAGGSGNRVLPNTNPTTRGRTDASAGGVFDLRGIAFFNYLNADGAYSLTMRDCAINRYTRIAGLKTPIDIDNTILSPSQTSSPTNAFEVLSCKLGGTISNTIAMRYDGGSGTPAMVVQNCKDITLNAVSAGSVVKKVSANAYGIRVTVSQDIIVNDPVCLGSYVFVEYSANVEVNDTVYYDNLVTDLSASGTASGGVRFYGCTGANKVDGMAIPLASQGPYTALVNSYITSGLKIRNIGTYASPVALSASVTGYIYNSEGGCIDHQIDRCYVTGTRLGSYNTGTDDVNFTLSHVHSDYADSSQMRALNSLVRSCGFTGAVGGTNGVFGSHWEWKFTSTTAGIVQMRFNEPTADSAAQVTVTAGTPKFNAQGGILMPTSGDQIVWEMPDYALGFTAFTNSLPSVSGTNATSAGSGVWGNHLIEFAINTGGGYGSWLTLTGANLSAQSITPSTGFKLKVRITCQVTSSTNALTNVQLAMDTTSIDQSTNLYPMDVYTLTLDGLIAGSDIVILEAGTTNIIEQVDANAGTTYEFIYETSQDVDIGILKSGYKPTYVRDYTLPSENGTLLITQTVDYSYA